MNKRLVYILGTGALAVSVLVGCGSQKETFKLYDVSKEIKNSTFKDQIAQVGDVVLREDGSMTVGEVVEELRKNGPILIKDGKSKDLITKNSLIDPAGRESCTLVGGDEKEICGLEYVNVTEDALSAYECKVIAISPPLRTGNLNTLNFFYAGNICSGIYGAEADQVSNTKEYAKGLKSIRKWKLRMLKICCYRRAPKISALTISKTSMWVMSITKTLYILWAAKIITKCGNATLRLMRIPGK